MTLLSIDNLSLSIHGTPILQDVSMAMEPGKVLGVIGESGSGKSMTANAVMQLLPGGAEATGRIELNGSDLMQHSEAQMIGVRGSRIGMVFQEPMSALNPVQAIGDQVAEGLLLHRDISRIEALDIARETLARVGLPEERFPLSRFPHELSGGQRQRVVIAMAIANKPELIIADEPTTALDVTTQAQILELLKQLVAEDGCGLILITHDLAVVADMADDLVIMREGQVLETGPTAQVLSDQSHSYTQLLLAASDHTPDQQGRQVDEGDTVLAVQAVSRDYALPRKHLFAPRGQFRAVNRVSFEIRRGENLGLVGESGCGKSTLSRALLGLEAVQEGEILFDGEPVLQNGVVSREMRRKMQVVFQDPYSSFNPRHKVSRLITEPFHLLANPPEGAARDRAVAEALDTVNLPADAAEKYIHEFSGGQRQRIAIARALINRPELIILDEAVSALDVSIRAQILDLLAELSARHTLSYLFISHDLSVVRNITDRVMVMRAGEIVEEGATENVFSAPQHPYTRELIAAAPRLPDFQKAIA